MLRFGFSPLVLHKLAGTRNTFFDEREYSRLHALATSYLRAGATVKTTGLARTVHADNFVVEEASRQHKPRFMEVGVSDGSSAVGLLDKRSMFSDVVLTDRYPYFYIKTNPLGCKFYDADGHMIGYKLFGIMVNLTPRKIEDIQDCTKVNSLNPAVTAIYPDCAIEKFDVFSSVSEVRFDIIKCSNLLNLVYFSENEIFSGIKNLLRSLNTGGVLVISHNNEKYNDGEAVICARHVRQGVLEIYDEVNSHELLEIIEKKRSGNSMPLMVVHV
jgi:hypothetical protein